MLDVHPPEHGIHGVRDFFLHLLTITIGLLIAVGLEASVETMHHRSQQHEAEAKIREEIASNLETLKQSAPGLQAEQETMKEFIGRLRAIAGGDESAEIKGVHLEFHEEEIPDAAWRTASTTGVLEHMPYDEVEQFANAYREQALLQQMLQKTLEDYLELTPELDHKLSREEAVALLPLALRTSGHLKGVMATGVGTAESYQAVLK